MEKIEKWICAKLSENNGQLKKSFLFTYLWGLSAHGYLFLSNSITHDSIDEFINSSDMMAAKFGLGRIFAPLVYALRGPISAPWWLGLLMLLWISLAVYLVFRLFDIRENWLMVLTAGIMTVNMSLIPLVATYIHDVDCYGAALFVAVLAVFLWRKGGKSALFGVLPVVATLGLYQSYVSITITLVMMVSILELYQGKPWKEVFFPGLKAAAMVIAGALVYSVLLKAVPVLAGLDLTEGDYNSLDSMLRLTPVGILKLIGTTWISTVFSLVTVTSGLPLYVSAAVQGILLLICVTAVTMKLFSRELGVGQKTLLTVLCICLPVCMDVARILSGGISHDLMHYALWLVYLLALLLLRGQKKREKAQMLAAALICLNLFNWVQTANVVYTGKRFIQDANLSLFTRIVSDLEGTEGYVPGETPIVFIGEPGLSLTGLPLQYQKYYTTGFDTGFAIGTPTQDHYQCYFHYVMMYPGVVASDEVMESYIWRQDVMDMPEYPQSGSIAMLDGVVVVKLGVYR